MLLFGLGDGGIVRVSADGSGQSFVTTVDRAAGDYLHGWPEFLPDGRHFLYMVRSRDQEGPALYVGSLDSRVRKRIMPAYSRVAYAPSGHLLFVRNGTLMAQVRSGQSGSVGGALPLATQVKSHNASDAAFDVSSTGILIYRPDEGLPSTKLLMLTRPGGNCANSPVRHSCASRVILLTAI